MFGLRFVKFEPSDYIFRIKKGKSIKQGQGLSFWYYAPSTSILKIPVESRNAPFIFEEITSDYQGVSVQGEVVYRIAYPERIKDTINFSVDSKTLNYLSEEQGKIGQRIINITKTIAKRDIEKRSLKEMLRSADELKRAITLTISGDEYIKSIGIEITTINILAISPNKDTSRALEAETRERILKEADDAIYERRNASVEQERRIKENELNTEIAIENKKRQIREAQMDAERAIKEKEHQLVAEEMSFRIGQEKERERLIELESGNKRLEADSKAYAMDALMKVIAPIDADRLRVLSQSGMKPDQMIASAFESLSNNAEKIGELNISPDLLAALLKGQK
ncbi:MAG: SPFH domain-containing protein [Rectinemataceae bacterium]